MKFKLYLVLLAAFAFSFAKAQTNITLSSQSDVNSYQSNYGLTNISGQLQISGNDITDLTPLSGIISVGSLSIVNNANLASLHGLEAIATVGRTCTCSSPGLVLDSNSKLANIDGLSGITAIESMVKIANNVALTDINGLSNLTRIGDGVDYAVQGILIQDNPLLKDLAGFSNVSGVVGEVRIINNNALTDLNGLHKITSIAGYGLIVTDNNSLTSISALSNVKEVGGGVSISSNAVLPNLNGLQSLQEILIVRGSGVAIAVSNNPALVDVDSLSNFSNLRGPSMTVDFSNNPSLTKGCGLFPLLNDYVENCPDCNVNYNFSGSGVTKDEILANGPCRNATSCDGDFILHSQTEVDAFPANYGCSVIYGLLEIQGNDITNLDSLNHITKALRLTIINNPQLTDISGLSNLAEVDNLEVTSNTTLTSLVGLSSLTTVHETLMLNSNTGLKNLHGLESLTTMKDLMIFHQHMDDLSGMSGVTSIDRALMLSFNSLKSLEGLNATSIAGKFLLSYDSALTSTEGLSTVQNIGTVEITYNPKLQTIGMPSLNTTGNITVTGNPSLLNLDGLSSLTTIGGDLLLNQNPVLQNLGGLSSVNTLNGRLALIDNSQLTSLTGLDHITSIPGSVMINDNGSLRDLNGLGATSVGTLYISEGNLESLHGLENLTTIGQTCNCTFTGLILSAGKITNVNELSNLTSVLGGVHIVGNTLLTNIDGLSSLNYIGIDHKLNETSIRIVGNNNLKNIHGLSAVSGELPGTITITDNNILKDLDGLDNITVVGGNGIVITDNDSLSNVDGLSNISIVKRTVTIQSNNSLTNLDGLRSLTRIEEGTHQTLLQISNNDNLVNIDSLSNLVEMTGNARSLVFAANPKVTEGCGLYPLVNAMFNCTDCPSNVQYNFDGSGISWQSVMDGGPCHNYPTGDPTAATNLTFANVTDNSMDVSFSAGTNDVGYITIMRSFESGLPDEAPVDGTEYHVGNVIGCCTIVVGMGMDTTLHVVYLEPDLDYYFDVIPFSVGYDYRTDLALSGNQRTLPQSQPYPNPFVEELTIPVTVTNENATVKILISDQLGRPVSEIVTTLSNAGKHEIKWNRADNYGNRVGNGVYTYSISTPNSSVKGLVMAK